MLFCPRAGSDFAQPAVRVDTPAAQTAFDEREAKPSSDDLQASRSKVLNAEIEIHGGTLRAQSADAASTWYSGDA